MKTKAYRTCLPAVRGARMSHLRPSMSSGLLRKLCTTNRSASKTARGAKYKGDSGGFGWCLVVRTLLWRCAFAGLWECLLWWRAAWC